MATDAFLHGAAPEPDTTALAVSLEKKPSHRPSEYTQDIAIAICERIAQGDTLRRVCKDPELPSRATVFRWLILHADFEQAYKVALGWRAESRADEIIEIADDSGDDYSIETSEDGPPIVVLNKEAIARSKVRIEARQWLMAKEAPRKYGDKPPGDAPLADQSTSKSTPGDNAKLIEQFPMAVQRTAWSRASEPTAAAKQ